MYYIYGDYMLRNDNNGRFNLSTMPYRYCGWSYAQRKYILEIANVTDNTELRNLEYKIFIVLTIYYYVFGS